MKLKLFNNTKCIVGEEKVMEMIDKFVSRGKVRVIHFRDVTGTVDRFTKCFQGDGRMNPARVIKAMVTT